MKKILLCAAALCACLAAAFGCTGAQSGGSSAATEDGMQNDTKIEIEAEGRTAQITLADTEAAAALLSRLEEGEINYTGEDYGGFEKVGALGFTLPASDVRIAAEAGDVMLYQGDNIVIFYGGNAWSYTRLGRIEGLSVTELSELLCAGQGSTEFTLRLIN